MLPQHKTGIVYVERCRIQSADDRVVYVRKDNALSRHFSIPRHNACVLLLGPGTSLTAKAARMLGEGKVMVGFTGGKGTPLFFASINEYRPTEFMQAWCSFWFDEKQRLARALLFQKKRVDLVRKRLHVVPGIKEACSTYEDDLGKAADAAGVLQAEARFAKRLYATLASKAGYGKFVRNQRGSDRLNRFLDQGNYLAYGLAASVLWILGISHAMPLCHGKTRRGALVFDLADVIKDSMVMPTAFLGTSGNEREFREECIDVFDKGKAINILFDTVMEACGVRDLRG